MIKKLGFLLFIIALSVGCFWNVAKAKDQTLPQEAIVSYDADITVNIDNSINVTEKITYNTGPQEHHGIYRDIYLYSSQKKKMQINNITVIDENGSPYDFQISRSDKNIRIKIGDPDWTFKGQKTYIINYQATRAIAQLNDIDEIYWNVTGNNWAMPIYQAQASIILPSGVKIVRSACYYGPLGSTDQCHIINSTTDRYTFTAPTKLQPGSGLTIAIGFPKGIVTPYTLSDKITNFITIYWPWLVAILLPLLTLILSLLYWYRKGRDARGTGIIVPQYDILDELSPLEVGGIMNEKITVNNISAEIIYLATKGYLKIEQLGTDYELTKLKDFSDLPNDFDQLLVKSLFTSEKQTVKLSDLENVFYQDTGAIITSALNILVNKGYYKNLGKMKNNSCSVAILLFFSLWLAGVLEGLFLGSILKWNPTPLVGGLFLSTIIYGLIFHFSPAKTEKGVVAKEHILGLKDYLQIAEKDRLQFHNAPDKKPAIFEKLLPYALVLGVANIWAKEFEGIYTTPPSWYAGSDGIAFSAITFSNSLGAFSSFASQSMSSAPSSSSGGSGGGGSSGGGGGGGGGGSW
jgi:uncharacterized membrane protein